MKQAQTLLHSLSEKLRAACRDEKRRVNLLLAAGLGGMLLLLVSEWFPEEAAVPQTDAAPAATAAPDSYAETLEEQLTEMICRMEGAGQTRVMVMLAGSQLTRYAADTERSADTERREHVLLGDAALVEQVEAPQILGVAVVCEGGGDPGVQYAVTELVTALTGIGANHITVTKMAGTS